MYTTLNKIRAHSPCHEGWTKLLKNLGKTKADNKRLAITTILDSNGLDDALWCLRAVDGHEREMRLYAVDCARAVQHLMTDARSIAALDVAERFANGLATDQELAAFQKVLVEEGVFFNDLPAVIECVNGRGQTQYNERRSECVHGIPIVRAGKKLCQDGIVLA